MFERMALPRRFAHLMPAGQSVCLYSAFFVVRSWCSSPNFHADYIDGVGTEALTLITPIRDYAETETFQLMYRSRGRGERPETRRYAYKKGRAIAFGDGFIHSTEPGTGRGGEQHVYLCFTFGTSDQSSWPKIGSTLENQCRILARPDGTFGLTKLGRQVEAFNRELPPHLSSLTI